MFTFRRLLSVKHSVSRPSNYSTVKKYSQHHFDKSKNNLKEEVEQNKRMLKKWRREPDLGTHPLQVFDFTSGRDDALYNPRFPRKPSELKLWFQDRQQEYIKHEQRYIPERHETLGKDLAVTHFLLYRGGRVRRKGHTEFLEPKDKENLPKFYEPLWMLEEIDASKTHICYEGLENFKDLNRLKKASFRECEAIDDWCVERILVLCPNINHLDVSDCKKVSERCLEGIYRFPNLKTLEITQFQETATFELSVILLKDTKPDLDIIVKKAKELNTQP